MGFVCRLTDEKDTVDIPLYFADTTGFSLLDEGFKPSRPEPRDLYGGLLETLLIRHDDGKRRIPLDLHLEGSTDDDMLDRINDLQQLVKQAQDFHLLDYGDEVFLQFKIGSATRMTRFGVITGEIDIDRLMSVFVKDVQKVDSIPVVLTCKPHWESCEFNYLFNGGFEFWDVVQFGGTGADTEPDGWEDFESIAAGTGVNNRLAAGMQQGVYCLQTEVAGINNGDYKGIRQEILSRLTPGVTYTLLGWYQNTAVTNGTLYISAWGDSSGIDYAIQTGDAHGVWTAFSVAFTPDLGDSFLRISCHITAWDNGCSGTFYLDGMMVVRGTDIPDDFMEWYPGEVTLGPELLDNNGFEEWPTDVTDNQPDGWSDQEWQAANLTGEANNRESVNVEQGCYALQVIVTGSTGAGEKGVRQSIFSRIVANTEYILIAWVKNAAITNGTVRFGAFGDNSGWKRALDSAAANDEYTRYQVTFTPTVADTILDIYATILINGAGGSGTAYFDKMMVVEASVYNGPSFVPEAYMSSSYIVNHYDNDAGHINHVEFADIPGDINALTRLIVKNESGASQYRLFAFMDDAVCRYQAVYEAEDINTGGTDHEEAGNSGGSYNESASITGFVINPDTPYRIDFAPTTIKELRGAFKLLGRAETGQDWTTAGLFRWRLTEYQSVYAMARGSWIEGNAQELLDFGTVRLQPKLLDTNKPVRLSLGIQAARQAGEAAFTVKVDYFILMPLYQAVVAEGVTLDHEVVDDDHFVLDSIAGVSCTMDAAEAYEEHSLGPIGNLLMLPPRTEAKIYFLVGDNSGAYGIAVASRVSFKYRSRGVHLRGTE